MTTIADRLRMVREALGMTQVEIAELVGVSANTWRRCEQKNEAPNAEALTVLVQKGFDASWILTGHGQMRLSDAPPELKREQLQAEVAKMGYVWVPRFEVEVAAGAGAMAAEEPEANPIAFQREWLHREFGANPSDLVVVRARGDSMQNRIHDRDLLLVDRSEPKLRSGNQIYAFLFDGLLYVKRLQRRLDGSIVVSSDNDEVYPPEIISVGRASELNIIGRVLWNAGRI